MLLSNRVRWAFFVRLALLLTCLASCATPPDPNDPDAVADFNQQNDPLEPMNRTIFDANRWVDDNALAPIARAYRSVTNKFLRDRVSDLLNNLKAPAILANDLLEGKAKRAGATLSRFLLNTTFGVAGVVDVATPMGLPAHNADAGQTLAIWGIGEGFYLVLPFFGPSNPRDGIGLAADSFLDPVGSYMDDNGLRWLSWTRLVASGISTREAYLDILADVRRTSLDYYAAMRSLRRQSRNAQIQEARDDVWAPSSPQH